ncbi:MAG: nucleotidyltransferase family protein [Anaerolineae bacterium]|nr:nucleotidyltransferase family protein [Anaerolineae bacterium]
MLQILRGHRAEWEQLGVKSLALFGSAVRGDLRPDSDVDILVEFDGPATFDRYMELKFRLEALLGRSVDLVTPRALKPRLRPYVEKEAIRVS